jgi:cell division septation protein DedD
MNSQIQRRIIGFFVILIIIALFIPVFMHKSPTAVTTNTLSSSKDMVSVNIKLPPIKQPLSPPQSVSSTTVATASSQLVQQPSPTITPVAAVKPVLSPALSQKNIETRQRLTDAQVKVLAMQHTLPAVSVKKHNIRAAAATYKKKPALKKVQRNPSNKALSLGAIEKPQAWVLQVASFSHSASAKKLTQALRQQGFDSYFKTQQLSSRKSLTRVFVGPELKKAKVQALQKIIKKQFGLNSFVRKYTIS